MKRVLKVVGAATAICAGVAGGLFLYSKIRKNKSDDLDEFDEFDDDFTDEEETTTEEETKAED